MEASNFRIGNYVDLYGGTAQVQRSDFDSKQHGIAIDSGKPIPLSVSWLENFGFFLFGDFYILETEHAKYFAQKDTTFNSGVFFLNRKMNMSQSQVDFIANVHYVHQLQNIYFALHGVELKLKSLIV